MAGGQERLAGRKGQCEVRQTEDWEAEVRETKETQEPGDEAAGGLGRCECAREPTGGEHEGGKAAEKAPRKHVVSEAVQWAMLRELPPGSLAGTLHRMSNGGARVRTGDTGRSQRQRSEGTD